MLDSYDYCMFANESVRDLFVLFQLNLFIGSQHRFVPLKADNRLTHNQMTVFMMEIFE